MELLIEWPGAEKLIADLQAIPETDFYPLMERWTGILIEGNRRGVLSGVDGYNQPMPPLFYRDGKGKRTRNRRVPNFGTTKNPASYGNLTTAEYQELTGPRLAPRREQSRVITNLMPRIDHPDPFTWVAIAAWDRVVSDDGTPFLPYHFDGEGQAQYDLRPVRPEDVQFCANALEAFAIQQFFASI